jgi:Subtilase family.
MSSKIKIAIIDSGINRNLIQIEKLKDELIVDENNVCKVDNSIPKTTDYLHGTICALIIEKYCPDCVFSSIRILDETGKGGIEKIEPALEWCCQNNITLVNLSLGTTHFKESEKLNRLINRFVYKGLIIVAAVSNIGFFTFPASFSNVIGVSTKGNCSLYVDNYVHLGIDTVVSSEHIIELCGKEYKTSLSNSYAAPYVSALIIQKIIEGAKYDIHMLKEYVRKRSHIDLTGNLYNPDWIFKAYMKNGQGNSKENYYFEVVSDNDRDFEHEADTIIANSLAELEKLDIDKKNLVYLGDDDIENINISGFKWSWHTRVQQIIRNQYEGKGLDIPLVILEIDDSLDKYYILSKFRKLFENDGYNSYVISMEPEGVLYRFEYIPDIQASLSEQLIRNFVEGQVFYKQNDLVLWNVSREQKAMIYALYPKYDIEIVFGKKETLVYIERNLAHKQTYNTLPEGYISIIYDLIIRCLTEEEHE